LIDLPEKGVFIEQVVTLVTRVDIVPQRFVIIEGMVTTDVLPEIDLVIYWVNFSGKCRKLPLRKV
jgi:hypothetical protein